MGYRYIDGSGKRAYIGKNSNGTVSLGFGGLLFVCFCAVCVVGFLGMIL
jgi:hypothetical protein